MGLGAGARRPARVAVVRVAVAARSGPGSRPLTALQRDLGLLRARLLLPPGLERLQRLPDVRWALPGRVFRTGELSYYDRRFQFFPRLVDRTIRFFLNLSFGIFLQPAVIWKFLSPSLSPDSFFFFSLSEFFPLSLSSYNFFLSLCSEICFLSFVFPYPFPSVYRLAIFSLSLSSEIPLFPQPVVWHTFSSQPKRPSWQLVSEQLALSKQSLQPCPKGTDFPTKA